MLGALTSTLTCALLAASASAQEFPSRPITLMVGLAAGGITDVTARLYAEAVSRIIGQRVSVENRAGAGGGLAAALVQNAPPDGYTLLVFSGSQHATVPAVGNASYDAVKGFAPISFLFNSVVALTVPPESPVQSMKELHELGRKKPAGLTFGTPGRGSPSHLLCAKILLADKVPFETAHYRGGAPMMADLKRDHLAWIVNHRARSLNNEHEYGQPPDEVNLKFLLLWLQARLDTRHETTRLIEEGPAKG